MNEIRPIDANALKERNTVIGIVNGEKMKVVPVRAIDNALMIQDMVSLNAEYNFMPKCLTCKHYDIDYRDTCLNPNGSCRVFEDDGYEPRSERGE